DAAGVTGGAIGAGAAAVHPLLAHLDLGLRARGDADVVGEDRAVVGETGAVAVVGAGGTAALAKADPALAVGRAAGVVVLDAGAGGAHSGEEAAAGLAD